MGPVTLSWKARWRIYQYSITVLLSLYHYSIMASRYKSIIALLLSRQSRSHRPPHVVVRPCWRDRFLDCTFAQDRTHVFCLLCFRSRFWVPFFEGQNARVCLRVFNYFWFVLYDRSPADLLFCFLCLLVLGVSVPRGWRRRRFVLLLPSETIVKIIMFSLWPPSLSSTSSFPDKNRVG